MVTTNTATLLPKQNQLGSLDIYQDGISSWRNSTDFVSVNKGLDSAVSDSKSILLTAPLITTEPIISVESLVPISDVDLGLNNVLPGENISVASYDSLAPIGTITLGPDDLFPQSQITPQSRFGADLFYIGEITTRRSPITGAIISQSTTLSHGVNPNSPIRSGFYFLNTLFTFEVNGIPQTTGLPVPLTGTIVPGDLTESESIPGAYNVIQILGGSASGFTATGQPVEINVLPFTVFSREITIFGFDSI